MKREELDKILVDHQKWSRGQGGQRAYLQGASLRGADLQDASLRGADLRGADLQDASLRGADLRGADLQDASLRGADLNNTIFEGINWLAYIGIVPDEKGWARAYKVTNIDGEGIFQGGINYAENGKVKVAKLNKDVYTHCAEGINLATFAWCLGNFREAHRLFLFKFKVTKANLVCPIATDGKFRVKGAIKVGECSWKGDLLK